MATFSRVRRGAGHPNSVLNWDIVREIRSSDESLLQLARRFGVDKSTIRFVRANVTWHDPSYSPAPAKRGRRSTNS